MPGINTSAARAFYDQIATLKRQVRALQTQQQFVVSDPTGATGDPDHGYATFVMGALAPLTGIKAYGAAKYAGGKWTQL